jgi:hypothetical protein
MRYLIALAVALTLAGDALAAKCNPKGTCRACKNCNSCTNCAKNGGTCSVCRKADSTTHEGNW